MRRAGVVLAVFAASVCASSAGAARPAFIAAHGIVAGLAADGNEGAFATTATADCGRAYLWQRVPFRLFTFGKRQPCAAQRGVDAIAVTGGRALWLTWAGGKVRDWQLWTASRTKRTPRQLQSLPQDVRVTDQPPIVLGTAGGGLLPYAVGSAVTALRANGSVAFSWSASAPVVALAAAGGRVAVAELGSRVTVLDSAGKIVSVDLFESDVDAVALPGKALLVQRGETLELRHGAAATERTIAPDARLEDANGKWAVWSAAGHVYVMRLADGTAAAVVAGSHGTLAGDRLYVSNGRRITLRTIR